jgi:cysteine synthase A
MALAMIEAAERDGRLAPGQTVVEYTGGSTGSSLALVCAVKGYPLRIVSSDAFAIEKIRTMRAFGAEVELIPSPDGITPDLIPSMVRRAAEIAAETGGFSTDQLNNHDMIDGYRGIGEELVQQLPGPPDITAFCSYVGTAGCFLGTTQALREHLPNLHRVAVEPAESAVLTGAGPGTHHIEGGGIGRWPPLLSPDDLDEVVAVSGEDAFAMARAAARSEGIFSGPSTGANLVAALRVAQRLGPGHRVVTVQVDSGLKYLGSDVYR